MVVIKAYLFAVSLTKYSPLVWPIHDNDKDIKRAASESNARDFEILITFQTENNSIKNDMGQHLKFLQCFNENYILGRCVSHG